jgi:hypothetical protein
MTVIVDCIKDYMIHHPVRIQLIVACIGLISPVISWLGQWYMNHKHVIKVNEHVERLKHDLSMAALKAESYTKNIYSIYHKLFTLLVMADSQIFLLGFYVRNNVNINEKEENTQCAKTVKEANDYLYFNLLFISEKVRAKAEEVFDLLNECLNDIKSTQISKKLKVKMGELRIEMQKELNP